MLLDWLPQAEFDRLLWSADLNIVRGEDSLVRALWAGAPFVWQLYPQHDGAHRRQAAGVSRALERRWRRRAAARRGRLLRLVECGRRRRGRRAAMAAACSLARGRGATGVNNSCGQADLTSRLIGFVAGKR